MATAQETAQKLVDGTFEVLASDNVVKAQVAAAIVDQLVGNDPHALVSNIPGIPAELVEVISDGIVGALEAAVLRRLNATPPTP